MQNAETVLAIIRERGQKGLHLEGIYRQLCNPDLYLRAYGRIYRNAGATTKGTTAETVDGMSMRKIGAIIDAMRHERYRWTPVRRTSIPKKNGKMRPLGIPTWSDKLVQEVMRSLLEAYYEPQFSDHSHGFRPGRGCHTALQHIQTTWKGTKWFVEGDIKGCFDNIDHAVLLSILREKIRDNRFLILVENLLKAGYLEDWRYGATLSGAPQGGVVSPILSNLYLDRLDQFVEQTLIPEYTRGAGRRLYPAYARIKSKLQRQRESGEREDKELRRALRELPTRDPFDPCYRRLRYIRYADDFLLGLSGPRDEAEEIKAKLAAFLRDDLKLELSPDKTLITHATDEAARFLGYDLSAKHSNARRSVNGHIALRLPPEVLRARAAAYKRDGKPIHRSELLVESDFQIVATYGAEYAGFVQYYKPACNVNWLAYLHWVMRTSLLKTLADKHDSTVSKMARRLAGKVIDRDGVRKCLEVVVEREGKQPLVARFGGISLARQPHAVIRDEPTTRFVPRNELLERLAADRCELCGSAEDVEVHHVRKLADLKPRGRRELPLWKRIMAARRRKTLVVCGPCHRAIHAGQPTRTAETRS